MVLKKDEVIILLGAGASVEAQIPASRGMIEEIERLLDREWSEYRDLYNYIKSAIYYANGIKGRFEGGTYNVEQLVNTLDELRQGDDHRLFPFVGAWSAKLSEVAGQNLGRIGRFRNEIVRRLRDDWVPLRYDDDAAYYSGLVTFQREYQHALRLFSLNYDLCVEKSCTEIRVERGFNERKRWDWRLFDETVGEPKELYLYKLHGSVDWTYDENDNLTYVDSISQIDPDEMAIIFGATYKLQYVDPFLFFAYELRRWTLDTAQLIIAIGYGFADEHINGILRQSLNNNAERRLLSVAPIDSGSAEERAEQIAETLNIRNARQIVCRNLPAKEFLGTQLKLSALRDVFPPSEEPFEELGTATS